VIEMVKVYKISFKIEASKELRESFEHEIAQALGEMLYATHTAYRSFLDVITVMDTKVKELKVK
jgi:hypothetical protein